MKAYFKDIVAKILGSQIRRLRAQHDIKVVGLTGSIGKTSSKLAIASVLAQEFTVRAQMGNYNDKVSMPLVFFGERLPNIFNPLAWAIIFIKNELKIYHRYPYQVVVLELGTDGPGQIAEFGRFLKVDIGVITAVTPEHMQFFADMDAVASEEIGLTKYSAKTLINTDLVKPSYLRMVHGGFMTYGIKRQANYRLRNIKFKQDEASFDLVRDSKIILSSGHQKITEPQLYSVCVAAAVATELGMSAEKIDEGVRAIPPVSGRMQHLVGLNGSKIIDDTYNASPEAMIAALDTLYRIEAKHKIAVLGNMNELGHFSEDEHKKVGGYCDPKQLNQVLTIGPDANKYLGPAAEAKGCKVKTFDSPYTAGEYLKELLTSDTAVLIKGSQNRVFAEETVKLVLNDPADSAKLVRQDASWLKVKQKAFK